MRKLTTDVLLIIFFVFLLIAETLPFLSETLISRAQNAIKEHQPERAEGYARRALRLDPFNAEVIFFNAGLLIPGSSARGDGLARLAKAEKLYKQALKLNDRCASCYVALARTQAIKGKIENDRIYLQESVKNLKRAFAKDPNGFSAAYESVYVAVILWDYLSEDERTLFLDRMKYCLEAKPWDQQFIYAHLWNKTRDFTLLLRITPDTVRGNKMLHKFIVNNRDLCLKYRKEQELALLDCMLRNDPEGMAKRESNKQEEIERIRRLAAPATDSITPMAWQGTSANGKNVYKDGCMYWTGTIYAPAYIPKGVVSLAIDAKGEEARGVWPYMVVEIDGEEVGGTFVASAEWEKYVFETRSLKEGTGVIGVSFINDGSEPEKQKDRNLYVGAAKITKIGQENDK
jgi:tetratricopeptide (TPR) repeat protein